MSEANLYIGQLSKWLNPTVLALAAKLGIPASQWNSFAGPRTEISLFNLSTVVLFNKHVANLEGSADLASALDRTRFRHLPWWQMSIWFPVAFQPPKEPLLDKEGWPVFLGSCQGLLDNLTEIQKLSNLNLGPPPSGYDEMPSDFTSFLDTDFSDVDERFLIQWVWRGLFDGATLARQEAPMELIML